MNPVSGEVSSTTDASAPIPEVIENDFAVADMAATPAGEPEPPAFIADAPAEPAELPQFSSIHEEPAEVAEIAAVHHEPEPVEPEHIVEATAAGSYFEPPATAAFSQRVVAPRPYNYVPDDAFHVTVIEERNSRQRNGLLLGSTVFIITLMLFATVYSLFAKDISIGSIGGDNPFMSIPEIDPVALDVEKDPEEKQKQDKSGGGGGGGNKEEDPASKGATPAMMKNPDVAPSSHMDPVTNPALTQRVGVNGPDRPRTDMSPYGLPNGADKLSDGPGSGTGIGTGRNGGAGSGNGSGLGSGNNGGAGSGDDGGNGGGHGAGDPPPAIAKGETVGLSITSKPRANYTDTARQNNIQGVVRLKVTFLANGQIGSVSAVSGLPNGLTEQAIAAAKGIRFTPKKVNGVAVPVSRVVEYSFTIY